MAFCDTKIRAFDVTKISHKFVINFGEILWRQKLVAHLVIIFDHFVMIWWNLFKKRTNQNTSYKTPENYTLSLIPDSQSSIFGKQVLVADRNPTSWKCSAKMECGGVSSADIFYNHILHLHLKPIFASYFRILFCLFSSGNRLFLRSWENDFRKCPYFLYPIFSCFDGPHLPPTTKKTHINILYRFMTMKTLHHTSQPINNLA